MNADQMRAYANAVSLGEPHEIPATSPWRIRVGERIVLIWGVLAGLDSELHYRTEDAA